MSDKIQPLREPGSLDAVTVELRGIRKKLERIVEHLNTTGTLSGQEDELHAALVEHKAITGQYCAALQRIIDE